MPRGLADNGSQYAPEEVEFLRACDEKRTRLHQGFLRAIDFFHVMLELGYRRTPQPTGVTAMGCDAKQMQQLTDLGIPQSDIHEMVAHGLDFGKIGQLIALLAEWGPKVQELIEKIRGIFGGAAAPPGVFGAPMATATPAQQSRLAEMGLPMSAARLDFGRFWAVIKVLLELFGGVPGLQAAAGQAKS